ncbi:LysR substrate-binding domain-containing protein [Mitsuaria sp. GD03876]|uniref:LysR substrate-binding domain-containing protein n=1 Tax=Mitsuaria sp. GD03876 TaxID=2975399 RepID=UPI002447FECC|nr:LysR substrate-binding domain-containing protein [Mitsuaria sp. GD03876]MDH0863560.1 LysR substrate-binding domain-containing protein [Mitsuaria sp. GD03876]
MDHLDRLRCFIAVADTQSFAAAARRLGCSAPAATRAIAALEQRLGVQLFQRSTRSVRLTEAGERFVVDCRRILADLDESEATAAGAQAEPAGLLALTAPSMFGRLHVAPIAAEFLHRHPRIRMKLLLVDRVVSLVDEAQDLAVRIAHLPDSGLTAVPVGAMRRVIVAAPDYLARVGEPASPRDLVGHRIVGGYFDGQGMTPWRFREGSQALTPTLMVNDSAAAIAAAVAGVGLVRCQLYQAVDAVLDGRLRIVLADHEIPAAPVHLVHAAGRRVPATLRLLIDFLAERLRAQPVLGGEAYLRDA